MILPDLKDRHKGEQIWVCGSGPSMGWVTTEFFEGKTVVAINEVGYVFGLADFYVATNYSTHHPVVAKNVADYPHIIVVCPDMNLEVSDMTATPVGVSNNVTLSPHKPFWNPEAG